MAKIHLLDANSSGMKPEHHSYGAFEDITSGLYEPSTSTAEASCSASSAASEDLQLMEEVSWWGG